MKKRNIRMVNIGILIALAAVVVIIGGHLFSFFSASSSQFFSAAQSNLTINQSANIFTFVPSTVAGNFYDSLYDTPAPGGVGTTSPPSCGSGSAGTWVQSFYYTVLVNGKTAGTITPNSAPYFNPTYLQKVTGFGSGTFAESLSAEFPDSPSFEYYGDWYDIKFTPTEYGNYSYQVIMNATLTNCEENNYAWASATSYATYNITPVRTFASLQKSINLSKSDTPPPKDSLNFFSQLQSSVVSFMNSIISSISQYFKVPSNLFTIGYSGVNAKNITTVGTDINVSISESIPSQYLSNEWTTGVNKAVQTFCGSYTYYNSTKSYIYESPVINMTSANYSDSFSFVPQNIGIYVVGSSCLSSNTTYANGEWSNWTAPSIIYQQDKAIAVVSKNYSVSAPVTSVNISSSNFFGSILQDLSNFMNGAMKFFTSL